MDGSTVAGLRLSLADIALTAGVQRPVVSVWRRRYAAGAHPFPAPAPGSPQRFDASEVADWIEATGLGRNRAFREDVALRAVLAEVSSPASGSAATPVTGLDGLAAMLCLTSSTGAPLTGLDRHELLDLADETDPDDACVFAEVQGMADEAPRAAALADALVAAAYTPAAAVEALLADRFRDGGSPLAVSALSSAALGLVAEVAGALVGDLETGGSAADAPVADPYPGCGDLLVAVLGRGETADLPCAHLPAGSEHRLARRRLGAHGWDVVTLPVRDGALALPRDALVVTQLPPAATGGMPDEEVLARLDEIVLGLGPGQRAVVIGPASALVDRASTAEVDAARSALLRTDRVRTVVRLPAGMVVQRPRDRLALWVLGEAHPEVEIRDRWTMVADLSGVRPRPDGRFARDVLDDLATDVVAAAGSREQVLAHAFRFARFVQAPTLLASRGGLLDDARGMDRGARPDGGATAVEASELLALLARPVPPLTIGVERSEGVPVQRAPLDVLLRQGAVRRVPGNRVDLADVVVRTAGHRLPDPGESRVVGVAELTGRAAPGVRTVDRLRFAARYPAGRLTEPGDVVFCTTPHPAATVDVEGFSVVEFPAQVLRVREARGTARGARSAVPAGAAAPHVLVPEVLAHDLATQPAGTTRWRSWQVRLVPAAEGAAVGEALREVAVRRRAVLDELASLDRLTAALADGATSGVVRLRKDDEALPGLDPAEHDGR